MGSLAKQRISGFLAKCFPKMIAAVKRRFHSPELYPLDPNELKIQALEAQLAAEKKKNEHFKAIEKVTISPLPLTSSLSRMQKAGKAAERGARQSSHREGNDATYYKSEG